MNTANGETILEWYYATHVPLDAQKMTDLNRKLVPPLCEVGSYFLDVPHINRFQIM
jgi:hypothetical protein